MDNDRYLPIGRRIRQARRRRGLSQDVLGGLIGRTPDWVSKVERGDIPVDRISVLIRVADVLRVPLAWLLQDIGYRIDERQGEIAGIAAVRRTLVELPVRQPEEPRPLGALERDLRAVEQLRADVRHADSLAAVPGLLTTLHDGAVGHEGDQQVYAYSLLMHGYELTARTLGRYGERHLSSLAAERAMQAATYSGRPEDLAFATKSMALGLQGLGYLDDSQRLAEQGLGRARTDFGSPEVQAVAAQVCAYALATTAARRGDERQAWEALDEADALTRATAGRVRSHDWMPASVHIQRVECAVDLGNPREALSLAARLGPEIHTSGISKSRRSRHLVDVALAYSHRRDTDRMVTTLIEVEQLAPEQVRNFPLVAEMLHGALRRERGPRNSRLHALASRLKVA